MCLSIPLDEEQFPLLSLFSVEEVRDLKSFENMANNIYQVLFQFLFKSTIAWQLTNEKSREFI